MSEQLEQTYGRESVERAAGFVPANVDLPKDEPQGDISIQSTELRDAADEIAKARNERQREVEDRPFDSEVVVTDTSGTKLPENQSLSTEEASHLVTGARTKQETGIDLDERAELARQIDAMRNGVTSEQLLAEPVAPVQQTQQMDPAQEAAAWRALSEEERNARWNSLSQPERERLMGVAQVVANQATNDLAQQLQGNPALLAAVSETVRQAQAESEYVRQQYGAAIQNNAYAAMAHTLATFPELQGLTDANQLAGALHAVRQKDPARAAAITEHIARTRQIVEESHRYQQWQQQQQQQIYQQWQQNQQAQFQQAAVQHDAAYEEYANAEASPAERKAIEAEAGAMLLEGGSAEQVRHAWNTNFALRNVTAQKALFEAARARLARRGAAAKRDRSAPHMFSPGSPVERQPEADHYLKRLEKPGEALSPKEAAAFVVARRAARRR